MCTLVPKEMDGLCEHPLGLMQLHKAKNQMIGQMTLASENNENMMLTIGKSFLIYGKVDELDSICQEIREITPEQLERWPGDICPGKAICIDL